MDKFAYLILGIIIGFGGSWYFVNKVVGIISDFFESQKSFNEARIKLNTDLVDILCKRR